MNTQTFNRSTDSLAYRKIQIKRLIAENFLVFFVQYMGLSINPVSQNYFPLWLAAGTSIGFAFLRGYTILPGIILATFLACYLDTKSLLTAFNLSCFYFIQTYLLLWISYRYIKPTLLVYTITSYCRFIIYFSGITALLTFFLFLSYTPPTHSVKAFIFIWLNGWLADLNSIFIIGTAIITFDAYFPDLYNVTKKQWLGVSLLLITLLLLTISISLGNVQTYFLLENTLIFFTCFLVSWVYGRCIQIASLFTFAFLLSLLIYIGLTSPNFLSIEAQVYFQLALLVTTWLSSLISIRRDLKH